MLSAKLSETGENKKGKSLFSLRPFLFSNDCFRFINTAYSTIVVRAEGLEPTRLAAPDPKSGTSANFATPALFSYKERFKRPAKVRPYFTYFKKCSKKNIPFTGVNGMLTLKTNYEN
jgi:hypothetical protein